MKSFITNLNNFIKTEIEEFLQISLDFCEWEAVHSNWLVGLSIQVPFLTSLERVQFAGNIKLLVIQLSKEIAQMDVNKLSYWEDIWKLRISVEKCKVLGPKKY